MFWWLLAVVSGVLLALGKCMGDTERAKRK